MGLIGIDGGDMTDEESKSQIRALMVQIVPVIIQNDPRKLYEFFDDQNIRIFIGDHPDNNSMFTYHNSRINHSFSAENRIDAEKGGFLGAFDFLEKELQAKGGLIEKAEGNPS